jgi:PAS domain S-box-containing protein
LLILAPVQSPETRYEELKRYVSFHEDDARQLAAFREVAAPEFPRIAREFYERVREHEDAHAVLKSEEQIERLHRALVAWMGRLCSGRYDEDHYQRTLDIGRAHVRVGLPQRYMFTAMALVRVSLGRVAEERMGNAARPTREALTRLLDLELAIMLEAYHEALESRAKRAEDREAAELRRMLARAHHRYMNAVESALVVIIGLDQEGKIRLYNREAARVTGFAPSEVMGESFVHKLLQEDLVDTHGAVIQGALAGHTDTHVLRSALRTRSGKYRDVKLQIGVAPREAADDVVLFLVGIDMTEENALTERTRRAERLASVGTLAAGLAHEIRNPLNGAQLHCAFLDRALERSGAPQDAREAVHVIADEIKRLANLVTEFLDFARPRPPDRSPVSILRLCRRVIQVASPAAEKVGVALEADLPTRDVEIGADGAKLEQVLLNLIQNAIEAIVNGGRVIVRARRQPRTVVLEVEDDGEGLANVDAPVFDPFYSTKASGTGLGLAIAHRIVTDHSGTIGFESRPGRTVFKIALPLVAE